MEAADRIGFLSDPVIEFRRSVALPEGEMGLYPTRLSRASRRTIVTHLVGVTSSKRRYLTSRSARTGKSLRTPSPILERVGHGYT